MLCQHTISTYRDTKFQKCKLRIFIVLMTLFLFQHDQLTGGGYEIVCRGGGALYFTYTPFSNFAAGPQIWITFQKAVQGVGYNWENINILEPGQCSFLDRPIHPSEPDRIIIKIRENEFSISWTQERVMEIGSSLPFLNNLQNPNSYQSFYVYNDGRGNLIVVDIGKSRP